MITLLILSALGLVVLNKMNPNAAAGSQPAAPGMNQVIQNATGNALTSVLGSRSRPPDYFASGNPQYNNMQPPRVPNVPRPVSQMRVPTATTYRNRVVPVVNAKGTSAVGRVPSGQTKPVVSAFVNTRQVSRSVTAPELAQPFWARRLPTR